MGKLGWSASPACTAARASSLSLIYVAAPGKDFPDIASVDTAGVKIRTIQGAPSERVLTRVIKAAEIVRIPFCVAAALPKGRCSAAQAMLAMLVDEAKQSGGVQKAIDAKSLKGVNVAAK
jgi:polar amino acid transport system substrate-binding protein